MDLSLGLVGYLGFLFVLNGLGNVEGLGLPRSWASLFASAWSSKGASFLPL